MSGPAYFYLVSNASAAYLSELAEALAFECASGESKPAIVNQAPDAQFRSRSGRWHREDPLARYGEMLESCDVPLLAPTGAAEMLEDAARARGSAETNGRSVIFLARKHVPADTAILFDALCLAVALDSSSTAFVYDIARSLSKAGRSVPIRVLVAGDSRIERCAEFFVELVREIGSTIAKPSDISFGGCMCLDSEETELAARFGVSTIEAFPEGSLRGQARYAALRLFAPDPSGQIADLQERQRRLAAYLRARAD